MPRIIRLSLLSLCIGYVATAIGNEQWFIKTRQCTQTIAVIVCDMEAYSRIDEMIALTMPRLRVGGEIFTGYFTEVENQQRLFDLNLQLPNQGRVLFSIHFTVISPSASHATISLETKAATIKKTFTDVSIPLRTLR